MIELQSNSRRVIKYPPQHCEQQTPRAHLRICTSEGRQLRHLGGV